MIINRHFLVRYKYIFFTLKLIRDAKIVNFSLMLYSARALSHQRELCAFNKIEFISFICPKKTLTRADIESPIFPFYILSRKYLFCQLQHTCLTLSLSLSLATDCVMFFGKEEICINLHRKYK